jgi:hypothetical protein
MTGSMGVPFWLPLLLGFLTAVGRASPDMCLPAFPRIPHPLVRALLGKGLVRPDRCAWGSTSPAPAHSFWERTAVPDIRRQGEFLAEHLATLIRAAPKRLEPITA